MKFKLLAAILGFLIAIPGVVIAQNADDQAPDQDSQPAPSVQGPVSQGPNDQGSTDQGSDNQSYDTPAPAETNGVARVSLIHGDVSTQRGDSGSWTAAVLNAPVVAGDRVSTGDKARTELQLDYANMLRLAEHTQANITQLTRSQIQIQLGRGMANYTVFKNSDADAEIDTPNVAIRTNRRESSFRILVTFDDHTEVLVRRGEVEVTTPQGGTRVGAGQFITVQGAGDQAQYKIGEAPARDDFDQWNTDRDNMIQNAASRRRTNDYYVGAEDLDNHGTWTEVPDYGPVWRPTVDPGWAPYRDGRWVYEPYWGWTWVSDDSWGWAPYHYGRWMMYDDAGPGGLVQSTGTRTIVQSGRRLMFRSSDSEVVSASASGAAGVRSAGFPLDRVIISILGGGAGGAGASTRSTLTCTTAAAFVRCTAARGFRT